MTDLQITVTYIDNNNTVTQPEQHNGWVKPFKTLSSTTDHTFHNKNRNA